MREVQYISYTEWAALAEAVQKKGIHSQEFQRIKYVYPQSAGEVYSLMMYKELASLEECILKNIFIKFQKAVNECLEETDIEIAESAIRNLKKNIKDCLFFNRIPEYPESIKNKMTKEVKKNVEVFRMEYLKYMKRIEYANNSSFIQDLMYISKKMMPTLILGE